MDIETFKRVLPSNLRKFATPRLMDHINTIESNPVIAEQIEDNAISYAAVLSLPNVTLQNYLDCVIYASHKLRGDSAIVCYAKTFPARYAGLVARGEEERTIRKYAEGFERNKLFTAIMEQAIVPSWILNQDVYQKAINVQADLMMNSPSDKVRCEAANSLLIHLARPKEVAPLVNINLTGSSELDTLKKAMLDLATNQQGRILEGTATSVISGEELINDSE